MKKTAIAIAVALAGFATVAQAGDHGPEFELGTRGSLEVDLQGDHGLSAWSHPQFEK